MTSGILPQHPQAQLGEFGFLERRILKFRFQLSPQLERLLLAVLTFGQPATLCVDALKFIESTSSLPFSFSKCF
jgi:hypothetical protein